MSELANLDAKKPKPYFGYYFLTFYKIKLQNTLLIQKYDEKHTLHQNKKKKNLVDSTSQTVVLG